jgi:hypothetical protein
MKYKIVFYILNVQKCIGMCRNILNKRFVNMTHGASDTKSSPKVLFCKLFTISTYCLTKILLLLGDSLVFFLT